MVWMSDGQKKIKVGPRIPRETARLAQGVFLHKGVAFSAIGQQSQRAQVDRGQCST
jgi:hypothetical protein